jgi:hypothetical protein
MFLCNIFLAPLESNFEDHGCVRIIEEVVQLNLALAFGNTVRGGWHGGPQPKQIYNL